MHRTPSTAPALRPALPSDALCLSLLATQVFLDTYATDGINTDLAHEVALRFAEPALVTRLADPAVEITVAENAGNLFGFVDLQRDSACPITSVVGPEVRRLYVQAPFQNQGLGRALLAWAESRAVQGGAAAIWLTTWVGNTRAIAFYPQAGYRDVGSTQYIINGQAYENRVFAKALGGVS